MRKYNLISVVICGLFLSIHSHSAEPEQVNRGLNRSLIKKMNTTDFSGVIEDAHADKYGVAENIPTPKAGRFQLGLNLSSLQTDALNNGLGAGLSVRYHLTETWALGLSGTSIGSGRTGQGANIEGIQQINLDAMPRLRSYNSAFLSVTPFYGKWSFSNTKIVSWDLYLNVGSADVKDQNSNSANGLFVGVGQLFSLSENSALDVGLQSIQYRINDINAVEYHRNEMSLIVGYSYFLPKLK